MELILIIINIKTNIFVLKLILEKLLIVLNLILLMLSYVVILSLNSLRLYHYVHYLKMDFNFFINMITN